MAQQQYGASEHDGPLAFQFAKLIPFRSISLSQALKLYRRNP
jgi:hypothetical protein